MAYAALVSLENTIHRFLNGNLYSICVEEKQQITSLLEYVTPIRNFLEEFPNESNSWEEQMRELADAAEDILEYLVLEKVFLPCENESESHPSENHRLHLKKVLKETHVKLDIVNEFVEEFPDDAKASSLKGRITEMTTEMTEIYAFYKLEKTHRRFREKWRFLPSELGKLKPKIQFIRHLNETINELDSIVEEVMAIKNDSNEATSSPALAPVDDIVGFPQDDADASECYRSAKHELQLEKVMVEIASISAKVSSSSKEVRRGADSSSAAPAIHRNSLVGFEEHVMNIKDLLCGEQSKLQVIPVCGMGGIGKTTLARNVYDDQLIKENFDVRVWVTVSQDYSAQRILSDLLESLKEYSNQSGKEESAHTKVYQILMGRKYLVVMDDIWRSEAWDIVRNVFPDNGDGSRIMLTTRLYDVASYPGPSVTPYELDLLDEVQSWSLLKEKVFANQECPSDLENIGKDIARSCKGLPLAIVVIAGLLSTVTENPSSWLEVAGTLKSATTDEKNHIEEILSLSYVELPQLLRPCFLYMASFPEDHEIYTSKLIRLWIAEGFLKFPINAKSFEEVAEECLEELVKRNLVFVTNWKSDGRIKSCILHDLIRELCIRKAHESKFFLNLMDEEKFMESIKNERRVSTSNLNFFSSYGGSTIHSIKCFKYHIVKLDFVEGVRLVRVLDAEAADVEPLPSQLFELFHLRYLAVTYFHRIPSILSKLKNLQTLIVRKVKRSTIGLSGADDMLVPWCMKELRHVYFYGEINFEYPIDTTCSLENLHTVSWLNSVCCRERILKKIPNLKKLKVYCDDYDDDDDDGDPGCLNNLVHLHRLENLELYAAHSFRLSYNLAFPGKLKRLSLRDLKLPWNDMIVVGSLPNLQVLKLRGCTCSGGTWETTEGTFPVLEVLRVERSRFENWITECGHFPKLKRLLLDSCQDLNEIPSDIGEIPTLELIVVVGNVKESLLESAEVIRKEQDDMGNNTLQVVCIPKSS